MPAALFLTAVAVPTASHASQSSSGTIYGISIEEGKAFFYTTGARSAVPGCSTVLKRWVFNAATANGQAMLSALLTFYSAGKAIAVTGTGACTDWGDTETVRYVIRSDELG
jgi:hypothetical protein